jgi:GH15 family glucan-1,4-alpha-glucosidase
MSRAITIGNGSLLVGIDYRGQVRDFYFPYVGHSNHVSGASGSYTHRIGVWIDGKLKWLSDPSWQIRIENSSHGTKTTIHANNDELGVVLAIEDAVHNEKQVFMRKIVLTNVRDHARDIRVFFGQEFRISESRRGDTALYDPRVASVIHYKGRKVFLIHATINGISFDDYSVGIFGIENREGTYADAEDGKLSRNAIEHGSVDSVIGLRTEVQGKGEALIHYWIAVANTIPEVHALHHEVLRETPEHLIVSSEQYWRAWIDKEDIDLSLIEPKLQSLYRRSLLILRIHADNRGGIIASSDSDMLNQGRDSYSYVWPRDAAISAHALDRAHYFDTSERFFSFIAKLVERDGYLMHKYRVDGVLGSSWHPWVRGGKTELPIQEDETATVVYMLKKHYELAKDLEFIESLYNPFIEPAADFMSGYTETVTNLPIGSYELWEEKYGTSTYTASAVHGALTAAAELSTLLGKRANAEKYRIRAERIKEGILAYLYDADLGMFIKLIRHEGDRIERDTTVDMSSFHGVVTFGVLDAFDSRIVRAHDVVRSRIAVPGPYGGYMRYEGDNYYRTTPTASPNAWCITTLWLAQYYIKAARTRADLALAHDILVWANDRASESGVLPEQLDPNTGAHLSTAPLVWSHAEYVIAVHDYIEKYKQLS